MLARHAKLPQVQSVWVVSWAADCLFEKVELLSSSLCCYTTRPTSQSFLSRGGTTPDLSIGPVMR